MVRGPDLGPKILGLIDLHAEHPEAVEAALIGAGLRWRDAGSKSCDWADVDAVLSTQPWDSALARAMKPDEWSWYGPHYPVLVRMKDHLARLDVKTLVRTPRVKAALPKMTRPPWEHDESSVKYAPEPSTQDDIDAHIARLNGGDR